MEGSPELLRASRSLAMLALTQQDRPLSPREREDLRRGLAAAGDALGWSEMLVIDAHPVVEFALDVMSLAALGVESLGSDLAEERANKQAEVSRLSEVAAYARDLAADPNATYPAEITYCYTARDSFQGLVTRTARSTVCNSHEALGAAESLDKSIESRGKLAELMVVELDERSGRLQEMTRKLPDFVQSSRGLLAEVITNLT